MSLPIAIAWDRKKFQQLMDAHEEAVQTRAADFELTLKPEGTVKFLTSYAGYLIQFLDVEFEAPNIAAQPNREGEEGQ